MGRCQHIFTSRNSTTSLWCYSCIHPSFRNLCGMAQWLQTVSTRPPTLYQQGHPKLHTTLLLLTKLSTHEYTGA
jgi:hypothetical protein